VFLEIGANLCQSVDGNAEAQRKQRRREHKEVDAKGAKGNAKDAKGNAET